MTYKNIPREIRLEVYEAHGWRCWYCGIKLIHPDEVDYKRVGEFEGAPVVDHIEALSKAGSRAQSNMRAACWTCNTRKRNRSVEEYRDWTALRTDSRRIALDHLIAALSKTTTPYDDGIRQAANWLISQLGPFMFYGEIQVKAED